MVNLVWNVENGDKWCFLIHFVTQIYKIFSILLKHINEVWIISLKLSWWFRSHKNLKCHTHSFVWMVSPDRNSWLKTPQRPKRLESSFYDGWLYVECVCVCVRIHVCLHVFELTEVVCFEWNGAECRSNSPQRRPLTHSGSSSAPFSCF